MNSKLLLVDDDTINGSMLKKRLEKRGFIVDFVTSGSEAIEKIANKKYELMLLDLLMPEMSGIETLKKVREIKSQVELSVVMVTAEDNVDSIVEALKLGANDFIQKPVNIDVAIARIQTQLKALQSHYDSMEKNQLESIRTLVATYNHEINNPLTIAFGFLRKLKKGPDEKAFEKLEESLNRVVTIVKKIDAATKGEKMQTQEYASDDKILKL
jgi:DNA-binding response OmpR family regulator